LIVSTISNVFDHERQKANWSEVFYKTFIAISVKGKGKVHRCTGAEALYRPYGP